MPRTRLAAHAALLFCPFVLASSQVPAHVAHVPGSFGTVHFPTSCDPRSAAGLDRAVALLHSFEFGASISAFNQVLGADPGCAMAQWGVALSRWGNPMAAGGKPSTQLRLGQQAAESATVLGVRATARERGYIEAVNALYHDCSHVDQRSRVVSYERAMGELVVREPTDTEAAIFHALALTAAALPTDKSYANQIRAGQILEALWAAQPNHPGIAHYIIHTYDVPALADRARVAAQRYAAIAPSAAHALHMPSHTFTRVGLWEESAATNARSMSVALASGAIGEALHAADYAVYADLQMGRDSAARVILDQLPALRARFDMNAVTGAAPASAAVFALAAIPARWTLERGAWRDAARLNPAPSVFPWTEAMTYFARSLGASRSGQRSRAREAADSLASIAARLAASGEGYWAGQVAIQEVAARAWLNLAEQRPDSALTLMRDAAIREDATEKSAVTPGPLAPARELLGDMLWELERRDEARAEYRATLAREPNRRHARERAGA